MINVQRLSRLTGMKVPTYKELEKLRVGDEVRVMTKDYSFRVTINTVSGRKFVGTVSPCQILDDYECGDTIKFSYCNVM